MNTVVWSDRLRSLWNLPFDAYTKIKAMLPHLKAADQEIAISELQALHRAFEKQYIAGEAYLDEQGKILQKFSRLIQRLEKKEKEVVEKTHDTVAMESILSQIES